MVIEQRGNANNGDIVVALIDEEEATQENFGGQVVVLCPAIMDDALHADRVRIQGVV